MPYNKKRENMKLEKIINTINNAIETQIATEYALDSNVRDMFFVVRFDTFSVEISHECQNGENEVLVTPNGNGLVEFYSNIEKNIADNLIDMDDVLYTYQMAHNDYWDDVDDGCDPAFPHYGDFERWAYGR